MTMKQTALSLNDLNKMIGDLPDSYLKWELKAHIDEMCQQMLKECLLRNQANNFRFHLRLSKRPSSLDIEQLDHYFVGEIRGSH